jgi:methyl-accepting chemotaxis protein
MPDLSVTPVLTHRQVAVLVVLLLLSTGATAALVLGPGRGAREDLGAVRADLDRTEELIDGTLGVQRRTLDRITTQLETTRDSLRVQRVGLEIARSSGRVAGETLESTRAVERQTRTALAAVRRVVTALGPLRELRGDVEVVTTSVRTAVELARATLDVAELTLSDGREALEVARTTLSTLQRSEQVQRDLLEVSRDTLDQVVEINRKIPFPPVFPTGEPVTER